MRALLKELLSERDYNVVTVPTAEAGLRALQDNRFDLMLVDWTLPGLSGLDFVRAVRGRPAGDMVVIIVITGKNRPEDLHAVLDAGASDYLAKPIDPQVLRTRLLVAERAVRGAERQREAESRLVFADRMASVGTLAAGVAHELNNPLMYVLSNLRLTREELDSPDKQSWLERAKHQLDEAIHGAVRMQDIVRDLKTFSRTDDEYRSNVDVGGVLESSINMCWNEIRHRAVLVREMSDTPPVDINESRLGQVFLNLLINAAQAMPARSIESNRITVRAYTDEGWAVIEVSDNGMGIDPASLSNIFEPFFTTKGVAEGTGLGLSICRNIVQAAGGEITAQSELGQGTCFQVRFPPSERATEVRQKTKPTPVSSDDRPAHVIVVDDEPLVGKSIRRALRNHDVRVFSSGAEALHALCSEDPIDVVFCDIMMPAMSGMEVYRRAVEQRPELASRFVFMTGGAFTSDARTFIEQTDVICLEKPFELAQIRDLVRERIEPAA
jgi:signal transduction histidine kinase